MQRCQVAIFLFYHVILAPNSFVFTKPQGALEVVELILCMLTEGWCIIPQPSYSAVCVVRAMQVLADGELKRG